MARRPCIEKDCVIEHNGRKYESGGSVITDDHLIAYPGKGGVLKTWHGKPIGTWRVVSSWRVNSAYGSYMHQIEATVDGITYTGRGFGEGMAFKGRRKGRRPQAKTAPLRAETIKFYGTVLEPKTIDHYGSRYYLKYASTKTPAKMRAEAIQWETGRKTLVREAENVEGAFCVYLGPKIEAKRGKRA